VSAAEKGIGAAAVIMAACCAGLPLAGGALAGGLVFAAGTLGLIAGLVVFAAVGVVVFVRMRRGGRC
jgi:hypothetical protein